MKILLLIPKIHSTISPRKAFSSSLQGVTVEQMEKAGDLVKSICQPKFKISDETAANFRKGILADDKDAKCYINCIFENMQAMKRGKFQWEATKKQAEIMLPDDVKEATLAACEACKTVTDGVKDPCEAAYGLLQCLKTNSKNFFFP
ncbi:general odorant-binding protein 72-like [Phlebotomus argentipes]|uniref:general odorant-binding protein 72-like n=1 Tax=Phlebotomus argentipes TaxID=94469 RepID=UPI0028935136|nr:general odorant-binding protein 72-like [Phlebotomus argentipes]